MYILGEARVKLLSRCLRKEGYLRSQVIEWWKDWFLI